jgi:hypothetical protein
MGNRSDRSADQALKQWLLDYRAKKVSHLTIRAPTYGNDIDALLLTECKARMAAGLPMDDVMLRIMLIGLLALHNKTDLLVENGGKYSFQHGWACRFWKRHNLVSRVVTTKMRILPAVAVWRSGAGAWPKAGRHAACHTANFDPLEENYISIAAQLIY